MSKPTMWLCAQRRLRSAWTSPSLIRVFAVRMKKAWVLSYPLSAQWRLWSDWPGWYESSLAQSHFVGFVIRWLNYVLLIRLNLILANNAAQNCVIFSSYSMYTGKIGKKSTSSIHLILHRCKQKTGKKPYKNELHYDKTCLCLMQTSKGQISRHISVVWPASLLFAA